MLYLVLTIVLCVLVYLISQRSPKGFPPGPWGIPVLGNMLQLGRSPHLKFLELKEKYGNIIGFNMGSYRAVCINDYKTVREALADRKFAGRPKLNVFQHRSRDVIPRGLLFSEGPQWMEQRKFAIRQLTELGYAKTSVESMIQAEILDFIEFIKNEGGHPLCLRSRFHAPVLNTLWSLLTGNRTNSDGDVAMFYKLCSQVVEENIGLDSVCMFVPMFAKIFPSLSGYKDINKLLGPLLGFFEKHIKYHKDTFISGQVRDFLDAYLHEIAKTDDPSSSFYKDVGDRSMLTTLLDLFFAGGETTGNVLHWTCLYLASYPEVQRNLQNEIDSVVGRTRLPELKDESSMKYTCALIQESLRKTSLAPMGLFHSTTEDAELQGFQIPKDTIIMMNFYGALHDKEYWGDPENFRPERFLGQDGKLLKHEPMIPFGYGKRLCFGEILARNSLFLWISTLFQKFDVSLDPTIVNPTLDPKVTWILLPPAHKVIFKQRSFN